MFLGEEKWESGACDWSEGLSEMGDLWRVWRTAASTRHEAWQGAEPLALTAVRVSHRLAWWRGRALVLLRLSRQRRAGVE
jgi:hypothetical protein